MSGDPTAPAEVSAVSQEIKKPKQDPILSAINETVPLMEWCQAGGKAFREEAGFKLVKALTTKGFTARITLSSASPDRYQPVMVVVLTSDEGEETVLRYPFTGYFRKKLVALLGAEAIGSAAKPPVPKTQEVFDGPWIEVTPLWGAETYALLERQLHQHNTAHTYFLAEIETAGGRRLLKITRNQRQGFKFEVYNLSKGAWNANPYALQQLNVNFKPLVCIKPQQAQAIINGDTTNARIRLGSEELGAETPETTASVPTAEAVAQALGSAETRPLWSQILQHAAAKKGQFENSAGIELKKIEKEGVNVLVIAYPEGPLPEALKADRDRAKTDKPTLRLLGQFLRAQGFTGLKFQRMKSQAPADEAVLKKRAPMRPEDVAKMFGGGVPEQAETKEETGVKAFIERFNKEALGRVKGLFIRKYHQSDRSVLVEIFNLTEEDLVIESEVGTVMIALGSTGQQKITNYWSDKLVEGMTGDFESDFYVFRANIESLVQEMAGKGVELDLSSFLEAVERALETS